MNEAQVKAHLNRMQRSGDRRAQNALRVLKPEEAGIKPHKFGAVSSYSGQICFDSVSEQKHYDRLTELRLAGHVLMIMRQTPFHFLPDHRESYRVDFTVFWACGAITFEDPKGFRTPKFNSNMQRMLREYPHVCIETIGRDGSRRPAHPDMMPMRQVPTYYDGSPLILPPEPLHAAQQKTSSD